MSIKLNPQRQVVRGDFVGIGMRRPQARGKIGRDKDMV
jgi:hypothetical protein